MTVAVFGESFTDIFISGPSYRQSPEADVPVILNPGRKQYRGGAANTAQNLLGLGVSVDLYTNPETITKTRIQVGSRDIARIDEETHVAPFHTQRIPSLIRYDAVVFSHYAKGFLTRAFVKDVITFCHRGNIPTFADTRPEDFEWFEKATVVKMDGRAAAFDWPSNVVVTEGPRGATLAGKRYPTKPVIPCYVAGAGDSFLAGLTVEYLRSHNLEKSVKLANKVARVAVSRPGISVVNASEV